jgi:putative DNA primase/helicase
VGYTPICKLVFLVNSLPETSDATYGFYRKLLIVPFNHKFTDEDKDVNLFEKLKAEMPGVFNWAIEGLRRLKENQFRFSQCDAAEHALQAYQEEQNAVPRFVADCVRRENGVCVAKSALLSAYRGWLERNGLDDPCRGNCQRFWREYKLAAELNGVPYAEKKIRGDRYIDDTRLEEVVAAEDGGIDFAE